MNLLESGREKHINRLNRIFPGRAHFTEASFKQQMINDLKLAIDKIDISTPEDEELIGRLREYVDILADSLNLPAPTEWR